MRMWHIDLLPYLPDNQFKGQLRELVAIMHDWRDKGTTNHLLINRVMDYPKSDLWLYFINYSFLYKERFKKDISKKIQDEFMDFCKPDKFASFLHLYKDWHDERYLRICMANLYEKYLGTGKNKITHEEWVKLLEGYRRITNTEYVI